MREKLTSKWLPKQGGQSLVEMALIAPILILMLLGVFEVGYALRGYLVLVNANREAARFAARGRFVNFNPPDGVSIGYENVISHTMSSLSGQIDYELEGADPNGTVIISHYFIDTGFPCDPPTPCNCSALTPTSVNQADDNIKYPGNVVTYTKIFPESNPLGVVTHFAPDATKEKFRMENELFNCSLVNQDPSANPSVNSVIIVEMFYWQDQLLGAPVIAQLFPNPVPLYASTVMRISTDTRSAGTP